VPTTSRPTSPPGTTLDNRWCQLEDPWFNVGNDMHIKVACFHNGQYADSGFFATYSSV
jgi:hypothetical protein